MTNLKNTAAGFWNNRAKMVGEFLRWVYDHGMSKTDQDLKDATNRRYYRYYNDGDRPRISKREGMTLEETLEIRTAEVTWKLFQKYNTPERRKAFYNAREDEDFDHTDCQFAGPSHTPGRVDPYWVKKYLKRHARGVCLTAKITRIEKLRKELAEAEGAVADEIKKIHKIKRGE